MWFIRPTKSKTDYRLAVHPMRQHTKNAGQFHKELSSVVFLGGLVILELLDFLVLLVFLVRLVRVFPPLRP